MIVISAALIIILTYRNITKPMTLLRMPEHRNLFGNLMTAIFCLLTLSSTSMRLWVGIDVDEVVLIPIAVLLMGKILS